jgi:hypothetical protein
MTRDDIESGVGVAGTVGVTTQERRQRSTQEGAHRRGRTGGVHYSGCSSSGLQTARVARVLYEDGHFTR